MALPLAQVIESFLERSATELPATLLSTYLSGSQVDGSAVAGSDVDFMLVVEDWSPEAAEALQAMRKAYWFRDQQMVDCLVLARSQLTEAQPEYTRRGRLLRGEDLLKDTPRQDPVDVAMRYARGSLRLRSLLRGEPEGQGACAVPDSEGETCGYILGTGREGLSSKRIVSFVARVAGTILAHQKQIEPGSKRECLALFLTEIGGDLAPLVQDVRDFLINDLQYDVPAEEEKLRRFRALLAELPRVERALFATGLVAQVPSQQAPLASGEVGADGEPPCD